MGNPVSQANLVGSELGHTLGSCWHPTTRTKHSSLQAFSFPFSNIVLMQLPLLCPLTTFRHSSCQTGHDTLNFCCFTSRKVRRPMLATLHSSVWK